jgi:glycosyltransferase involved in cell wall biosynthesis
MSHPAVTVFTSCYNQAQFLPAAIDSVLAQTFDDFELLLYNDGSIDDTWDIMTQYAAGDSRIVTHNMPKQPNVGYLLNASIRAARGLFWAWCPSDDLLFPECLAANYKASTSYGHRAVLYSHWTNIDADGGLINTMRLPALPPKEFRDVIWRECPICFAGVWIPTHIFATAGLFPEHLAYSEDYYWILRAVERGVNFRCVPELLHSHRIHANRITSRHHQDILRNVPTIREQVRLELADAD